MPDTAVRRVRARPMSPEERRDDLIDATLKLLREHGRAVTTRQIAEAAGVAEGTIFRVFETKEELIDAAIARAFEPGPLVERVGEIDPGLPLSERLIQLASIWQQRFRATFDLMQKVGMVRPSDHVHGSPEAEAARARVHAMLEDVVGADADQLAVPVGEFLHRLRLLIFAGSHPHITDGRYLTPEAIVETVLHGLLRNQPAGEKRD